MLFDAGGGAVEGYANQQDAEAAEEEADAGELKEEHKIYLSQPGTRLEMLRARDL